MRVTFDDPRLPPSFWDHVFPEPNSGCWLWVRPNIDGYGTFKWDGHNVAAHRLIVFVEERMIDDLVVDHRCEIKCCVNPDHLDVVTNGENVRRFHVRHPDHRLTYSGRFPSSKTVAFNIPEEEFRIWCTAAASEKRSLADWIRRACFVALLEEGDS